MPGTLVVGCGGSGCRVVPDLGSEFPVLTVNWENDPDIDLSLGMPEGSDRLDPEIIRSALVRSRRAILKSMDGYSEIVLVASPAGTAGSESMYYIMECARELGSHIHVVLTVPFAFEDKRRAAVLEVLPEIASKADRLFVADLQYSGILTNMVADDAINAVDGLTRIAVRIVAELLGRIPFFSTFSSDVYSFARGYSTDVIGAYEEAASSPRFSPDFAGKQPVLYLDSAVDDEVADALKSHILNRIGKMPELIFGNGTGKGITVFAPISLRNE